MRSRHSRALLFTLLAIVAAPAACGGGDDDPSELTGLIVDVRGSGDNIRSFALRTGDETYDIRIAPDVDYGFPVGHLRAHESALFPVRCRVERRAGLLYALEIADA